MINKKKLTSAVKKVFDENTFENAVPFSYLTQMVNNQLKVKLGVETNDVVDCVRGLIQTDKIKGEIKATPYGFEFRSKAVLTGFPMFSYATGAV